MNAKRPLALLVVAVMAVALFSAAPVAAQYNDCTATAVNTGNANNVDASEDTALGNLNDYQEAYTSASAYISVEQYSEQSNVISEDGDGSQGLGVVAQANDNSQDAC